MTKLNIGETILRLRRDRKITQKQLANMVGVSAGAVSKWETGNSTPDITLLSPIARALNTSLDILLDYEKELSEKKAIDIKNELSNTFLQVGYEEGELKCKNYLKEYPNSMHLKITIAQLIQMYCMMANDTSEEYLKEKMEYCLRLLYDVYKSNILKYTSNALLSIAHIEMSLERYEESEKALKELANHSIDPMVLYSSLYRRQGKLKEAEDLCKRMLMQYLNQGMAMMSIIISIAKEEKDYEKALVYLNGMNSMENTFKVGMCSSEYSYCLLNMELGKKDSAAKCFKKYVESVISLDYNYDDNSYFKGLKLEINEDGQKKIRKKLLESYIQDIKLNELKGVIEYEEAINKLKEYIKR